MTRPRVAEVAALADAAHGLLTTAQVLAAGLDPRIAERQVRRGAWQRPARGVYAVHSGALTGLALGHAARRLAGADLVVSGLVVLQELGLRWVPPSTTLLGLVPPSVRTPSSGRIVLRRTSGLDGLDTWRRDGLRMAPVQRAVVDACRQVQTLRDVRGIVLGAVADRWADVPTLTDVLATTQRNGSGPCRRALLDAQRGCASPPEAELVDVLLGCGVPFYVNPDLLLDGRLLGSPDVWFPGLGVGGEVDSRERHETDGGQVESTYDRHERMSVAGAELVHLSVRRLRRDVDEAARHLLRQAARLARPLPAGLTVVPRGPLLR